MKVCSLLSGMNLSINHKTGSYIYTYSGVGAGGQKPPKDFKYEKMKKIWGIFMHQSY